MLEKVAQTSILVGPRSSKRIFKHGIYGQRINCSFPSQNACLSLVIVVRQFTPDIKSASDANHGIETIVGNLYVAVQLGLICGQSGRDGAIGGEKSTGGGRQREQPRPISPAQMSWASPNGFLVGQQVF